MRNLLHQRRALILLSWLFVMGLLMLSPSEAMIFAKIPGVDGPETVAGVGGQLRVLSWSWGETNEEGGGLWNDFVLVVPTGQATTKMIQHLCEETEVGTIVLTNVLTSPHEPEQKYMEITLNDVIISSYQTGGSAGDVVPVDQVSLNFARIVFEYREEMEDGSIGVVISRECDNPERQSP